MQHNGKSLTLLILGALATGSGGACSRGFETCAETLTCPPPKLSTAGGSPSSLVGGAGVSAAIGGASTTLSGGGGMTASGGSIGGMVSGGAGESVNAGAGGVAPLPDIEAIPCDVNNEVRCDGVDLGSRSICVNQKWQQHTPCANGQGCTSAAGGACKSAILPSSNEDCLSGPVSLPGLSGPPVWSGAPGASNWRAELQDPRWSGAPLRTFELAPLSATETTDGQFRILVSNNVLYLSFQATSDELTGFDPFDSVYFGFGHATSTNLAWGVQIYPIKSGNPVAAPAGYNSLTDAPLPFQVAPNNMNWFETATAVTSRNWTQHIESQPTWLQDVTSWVSAPGVAWAITFKIDLADPSLAAPAGGKMKMFYGLRLGNAAGMLEFGTPAPASVPMESVGHASDDNLLIPRDPALWRAALPPGSACAPGLTVSTADAGVWNGIALTNQILACGSPKNPCDPSTPLTNKFRVNVQNVPTSGVSAHVVRSRILVSDWGSTIADFRFAPWKPLSGMPTDMLGIPPSELIASGAWGWTFKDGGSGTGIATIDFTCSSAAGSYCPKLGDANATRQAILVELAGAPAADPAFKQFARNAVIRTMDFAGLSTLEAPATISIEGLKALTGQSKARDVYLHVTRSNMPPHGGNPLRLDTAKMKKALLKANHSVLSPEQTLANAFPTYKVHVYYDTGETRVVGKATRKLLQPMVPFGFYFTHDGPLFGFTDSITGLDGVTLKKLGPDWYKVKIKSEGKIRIQTRVTAEERPLQKRCQQCLPQAVSQSPKTSPEPGRSARVARNPLLPSPRLVIADGGKTQELARQP